MSEMFDRRDLDRRHQDGQPEFIPFPRRVRLTMKDGIFHGVIVGCNREYAIIELLGQEETYGLIRVVKTLPDRLDGRSKTVEIELDAIRTGVM